MSHLNYLGHSLGSVYQPVVSAAHGRVVGGEILLRACDAAGGAVAPLDLFRKAAVRREQRSLDLLAIEAHLRYCKRFVTQAQWIFLNCQPETLGDGIGPSPLEDIVLRMGFHPSQVVIEVLEQAAFSTDVVTAAISAHQHKGFSVAVDDFGTGSSNFDRVWGVQPDFVKLDRLLVHRASLSRSDRRVAKLLVSMLHRMGAMVVAEGIETAEEALAMMDADVDFMQGYYLARPNADAEQATQGAEAMLRGLWPKLTHLVDQVGSQERAILSSVRSMLLAAARELQDTNCLSAAAARFFQAPNTLSCFVVDHQGIQIGHAVERERAPVNPKRRPLFRNDGANWSRRPYFKEALRRPGRASVYGPHCSLVHGAFIYTTAVAVGSGSDLQVLCGNFKLDAEELPVDVSSELQL